MILLFILLPLGISCLNVIESPVKCASNNTACDNQPADCSFLYDGHNHTHLIFTKPGVNITFSASGSNCEVRALAVGGGGSGYGISNTGFGGGSGYIKYYTQPIPGPAKISVMVGDHGEASTIYMETGDIVRAEHGQDAHHDGGLSGGDGYSGGGGYGDCRGGSDGSDGECSMDGAGSGTGEDVTSYKLDNYVVSPGAGGHYDNCGGGGGGVLVDGAGPGVEGAMQSNGQGYGGGGTVHKNTDYHGHSGVIILEIFGATNKL